MGAVAVEVRLRPMRKEDVAQVSGIESRSFSNPWKPRTFRQLIPRDDAELWVAEWREAVDDGEAEDPGAASEEGKVIGYLVLWFAADEGELADLAVSEEFRGRGIGGLLLAHAIDLAMDHGIRSLFLEVRASNERAVALYRSRGFQVVSTRTGYYRKPLEDALVMLKSLW